KSVVNLTVCSQAAGVRGTHLHALMTNRHYAGGSLLQSAAIHPIRHVGNFPREVQLSYTPFQVLV
ncbi:MAG: hypothetical protein O3C60_11635, partial [Planctomycetota bacterium]|nr:hypothetical protein [Planctomycetota bacterium]